MPLRLAVVDDEQAVRKALQRLLRSAGFDVVTFASGEDLFAAHLPELDCVLLDLHMPGMDGLQIAARLAEEVPGLPIVIVTGHDTPESRARARELGVHAVLPKPAQGKVLLEAILGATARRA